MCAMCASSHDPASLACETVPVPDPGPGEVLVEVHATAVTAGELTWPESWPAIPCHDLSGVVAETGSGVPGWRPGDEVYGLAGPARARAAAAGAACPGPWWRRRRRYLRCPARGAARRPGDRYGVRPGRGVRRRAWC